MKQEIKAGTFYLKGQNGFKHYDGPPRQPDVVICRRLEDFPNGCVPDGGAMTKCSKCGAVIVYNPARDTGGAEKACFQCMDIEPMPFEPRR